MINLERETLRLLACILAIAAGVLLLGPYLGIRVIAGRAPATAGKSMPVERESLQRPASRGREPAGGALERPTQHPAPQGTPKQKLSDIEEMLW